MPGGRTHCGTRQPSPLLGELISQLGGGGWGPFGHVIGEETDNRNGDAMVGEQKVWWWRQLWTGCSPDVILHWWAMSWGLKESRSWPNRPQAEGTYKGKASELKSRKGTKFGCRVVGEGRAQQHDIGEEAEPAVKGLGCQDTNVAKEGEPHCRDAVHLRSPFPGPLLTISFFPAALPKFPFGTWAPEQWCPSPSAIHGPPSYRFLALTEGTS